MLMPAAALIFVILGAIVVDFGAAQLGQRELVSAAQAAANDAANYGIDSDAFYRGVNGGELVFDEGRATQAAYASLAASRIELTGPATVDLLDADTIVVVIEAEVPTIFSKAVPGGPDTFTVTARATSELSP